VVGGAVRDLLLGSAHIDLDLVVVGDATRFASAVARQLGARATVHSRFGTATISTRDLDLDIVTARRETYARPGALPVVAPAASIEEDLARRDFSINAMAISLADERAGRLLDPFGGKKDLLERRVRVLHDRSFQDDPTRMLRAVRYAGRLNFRLERRTGFLLRRDAHYINFLSGTRLRKELERICGEAKADRVAAMLRNEGLLSAIEPSIEISKRQLDAMRRAHMARGIAVPSLVCIAILLSCKNKAETEERVARLSLTRRQADAVRGLNTLLAREKKLARPSIQPSAIVSALERLPSESVEAFSRMAERAAVRARVRRYLTSWCGVRPELRGSDIEGLGVPTGPAIGLTLRQLSAARLDGAVKTRHDEVEFVKRMLHRRQRVRALD
jgi:tRNA nucleotidyltransferase (CCA-adding enzyme)